MTEINKIIGSRRGTKLLDVKSQLDWPQIEDLLKRSKRFPNNRRLCQLSDSLMQSKTYIKLLEQYYELIQQLQSFSEDLADYNDEEILKNIESQKKELESMYEELVKNSK